MEIHFLAVPQLPRHLLHLCDKLTVSILDYLSFSIVCLIGDFERS